MNEDTLLAFPGASSSSTPTQPVCSSVLQKPLPRCPFVGRAWRELFINPHEASLCTSVAEAVALSHSLLVIDHFSSDEDCQTLLAEARMVSGKVRAQEAQLNPN